MTIEEAIKVLRTESVEIGGNAVSVCQFLEALDMAVKALDAVPVVRCRECKHHYWEQEPCHGKSVHYCKLPHMRGVEVFKEFFCYYGERKEV